MASVYKGADKHFTLTTAVATKITLPFGSKEHLLQISPDAEWEWSFTEEQINSTSGGVKMKAGAVYSIDSPVVQTEVWVKQSSGSDKELKWAYLYPAVR